MKPIRLIETGYDSDGKSTIIDDRNVQPIEIKRLPGASFECLWETSNLEIRENLRRPVRLDQFFPPPEGCRFLRFSIPPRPSQQEQMWSYAEILEEIDAHLPGFSRHHERDEPGMHKTDTIDLLYVLSGTIALELDEGETVSMEAGDAVAQVGTRHRWINTGSEPCVFLGCILGAKRLR